MPMQIVKNGSRIELPNDEVIVSVKITRSGQMQLEAPTVHPREVCKMLSNLIFDLIYASFQPAEISKIQSPSA